MPQPPNLGALLQQAQKMQEEMMAAQEKLKDERVEASAGGGMVKVVDDRRPRAQVARRSTPTRSTPRTSRCSRTWSWPRSTRRCARRSSCRASVGGAGRHGPGRGARRARRPGRARRRSAAAAAACRAAAQPNRAARRKQR